jgi:hypothetical protein
VTDSAPRPSAGASTSTDVEPREPDILDRTRAQLAELPPGLLARVEELLIENAELRAELERVRQAPVPLRTGYLKGVA